MSEWYFFKSALPNATGDSDLFIWDDWHPTTLSHKAFADTILDVLQ